MSPIGKMAIGTVISFVTRAATIGRTEVALFTAAYASKVGRRVG